VNFRRKRRRNRQFIHKTRGQLLRFLRRNIAQLEALTERGKDGRDVEFGPKALLSNVNGYCFLDHVAYEPYNEALYAHKSIAEYERRFGKKPKAIVGDGIFGNRDNRQLLGELKIRDAFKPLGRPGSQTKAKRSWLRKMLSRRNGEMEGIIGLGKTKYGLDRMLYRVPGCEEIWTRMCLLGMNLTTALQHAE